MNSQKKRSWIEPPRGRGAYDNRWLRPPPAPDPNRKKAAELFEAGRLQLNSNHFREAEKSFGKAMYLDSSVSRYHFYQGVAMMKQCAYKEAEWAFERASGLDPENPDYTAELGFVCLELGNPEKARSLFKAALRRTPLHARAAEGMKRLGSQRESG